MTLISDQILGYSFCFLSVRKDSEISQLAFLVKLACYGLFDELHIDSALNVSEFMIIRIKLDYFLVNAW